VYKSIKKMLQKEQRIFNFNIQYWNDCHVRTKIYG